jgi:hypothetical protein
MQRVAGQYRRRPISLTFPEDARWNADRQAVEFGVEIGEYRGVVSVPRRVFQRLLPERPTPERCVEAYYRGICDRCKLGTAPTREGASLIDPTEPFRLGLTRR